MDIRVSSGEEQAPRRRTPHAVQAMRLRLKEFTEGTEGMEINEITRAVIGCAMKAHSALGPGLLEKTYEACLVHELRKQGLRVESQVTLPVLYDGIKIDLGYRLDLVVEDAVVVELKWVAEFDAIHEAQLLSYLK